MKKTLIFDKFTSEYSSLPMGITCELPLSYEITDAVKEIDNLLSEAHVLILDDRFFQSPHIIKSGPEFEKMLTSKCIGKDEKTSTLIRNHYEHVGFILAQKTESETVDLPFQTVFIEGFVGLPILKNSMTDQLPNGTYGDLCELSYLGMLVHEVAPDFYKVFSLVEQRDSKDNFKNSKTAIEVNYVKKNNYAKDPSNEFIYHTLVNIFDKVRSQQVEYGSEKINVRFRSGSGKERKFTKIKNAIHIRLNKKTFETYQEDLSSRKIEWSHRWTVRGHWRSVDGIGKNREGNYLIKGFTWVTSHCKGPDDKGLVKKIRVFRSEQNTSSHLLDVKSPRTPY